MINCGSRACAGIAAVSKFARLPHTPIRDEVMARVPMLRAMARLGTGCPRVGEALVARTVRAALADTRALPPVDRLAAHLLAIQRRLATIVPHRDCASLSGQIAGTSVVWAKLDQAMRGLLALEREVLFLGDGAGLRAQILADSLGCSDEDIQDLRRTARFEVINLLAGDRSAAAEGDVEDDAVCASLLSIALYHSLLADAANQDQRDALGQMIADERQRAAKYRERVVSPETDMAISPPNRWLRLMYVAYSHPSGG
jgi:hypothetical protein